MPRAAAAAPREVSLPTWCRLSAPSPTRAGKSGQGWFYTPLDDTLRAWATAGDAQLQAGAHMRAATPTPVRTRWDGGEQQLECAEYTLPVDGAASSSSSSTPSPSSLAAPASVRRRRVMQCLFDGYHGSWLPGKRGEELTWWFFSQFTTKKH